MNTKHPAGYWVNQLNDGQIEELTRLTMSEHEKYSKMEKPEREETQIKVKFHYDRTNAYLHCKESTLIITDFNATGKLFSKRKFYEFMVKTFGTEYAEELVEYLEEKIQNLNQDLTNVKGLVNFQESLKADLQNENTL